MATPLMAVSGTFGVEYADMPRTTDGLGAVVAKSVTQAPRRGNPVPRIVECTGGMLNAIGLQNPGVDAFIERELPKFRNIPPLIASVAGESSQEYAHCAQALAHREEVAAIELNVSCPNVAKGGLSFGCDGQILHRLVRKVRKAVGEETVLIVKLTPNVTDIAVPARAAIEGGANAISLINTLRGMSIDILTRKPKLGNETGGVSGAVVHPVAVYMVARCYESCCREHKIPIVGIGGVSSAEDAIELMVAGATCVGIGTALFRQPDVFRTVAKGIRDYLREHGPRSVSGIVGSAFARK